MATVKIDEKLLKEVQEWLDENGNKYKHPTKNNFDKNHKPSLSKIILNQLPENETIKPKTKVRIADGHVIPHHNLFSIINSCS